MFLFMFLFRFLFAFFVLFLWLNTIFSASNLTVWDSFDVEADFDIEFICFNYDDSCYTKKSPWITQYFGNSATFVIPFWIDFSWEIILYWDDLNKSKKYNYSLDLEIIDISDWEFILSSWVFWDEILLQAKWIWREKWRIFIWKNEAEILFWNSWKIIFKIPKVDKDYEKIKIFRAWENVWKYFDFDVFSSKSNDPFSAKQIYLSTLEIPYIWKKYNRKWDWISVAVIDDWISDSKDFDDVFFFNYDEIPWNWIDDDWNWFIDDFKWWNFSKNSFDIKNIWNHWSFVSWIISAKKDDWYWISWISPNSKILPLVVFDDDKKSTSFNVLKAIDYAISRNVDIINLSIWTDPFWEKSFSTKYDGLLEKAFKKGIIVIVASWNWDSLDTDNSKWIDLDLYPVSPVCNDFALWVASSDFNKIKSGFSNFSNNCIDFIAPWENIFWIDPLSEDEFSYKSWTSFSTPLISASIAILWSNFPTLKNYEVIDIFKKTWENVDFVNSKFKWKVWVFPNIKNAFSEAEKIIFKKTVKDFVKFSNKINNFRKDKKIEIIVSQIKNIDKSLKNKNISRWEEIRKKYFRKKLILLLKKALNK